MQVREAAEARHSNELLHGIIRDAIVAAAPEVGPHAVSLVSTRGEISELLKLDDVIDLACTLLHVCCALQLLGVCFDFLAACLTAQ